MGNCKTYEEFVEKFKPKKTTDDCYTPPVVYQAIADWVSETYHIDTARFVRPFYPGGDYEHFDYTGGIVVDNPPFSILRKIVQFYIEKNIPFFLFSPTLVSLTRLSNICTAIVVDADVTYENDACVSTSFLTNLEPHEIRMRSCPELYDIVCTANRENLRRMHKQRPKYEYPPELLTSYKISRLGMGGVTFVIPRSESILVGALDSQRKMKKEIYGGGLLVSQHLAAEYAVAAEHAERVRRKKIRDDQEVIKYVLSDREIEIVNGLQCDSY